jgi:hypothetical protein
LMHCRLSHLFGSVERVVETLMAACRALPADSHKKENC